MKHLARLILTLMLLIPIACYSANKSQIFDPLLVSQRAGGVTLSGGKAYFYVPGTTTLKTVYADRNSTIPAANPYTLSADGTAQLYGDGLYDVKVTNSAGVQKFFWEDVRIQDIARELVYYDTLADAVASIGTSKINLVVSESTTVSTDLTIPSNIDLQCTNGATIVVASGKKLIINGKFSAGYWQVFTGTGAIEWGNALSEIEAIWFGSTNLQTAVYSAANQTAATTAATYIGKTVLIDGTFTITDTLIIPDHVWVKRKGSGFRQSVIQATGTWIASHPAVQIGRALGLQHWSHDSGIEGITVDANFKAETGVYSDSANEDSGIRSCWVRNALLTGIWFKDVYVDSTSTRVIHSFIKDVTVVFPIITQSAYYPTPSNCIGVRISGTRTVPYPFVNFTLDKITITAVTGQNEAAPVRIGAGFLFMGISGVSLTNSHAEYCDVDVKLGATYPLFNSRVTMFDGYLYDNKTIQLGHSSTNNIILENIDSNNSPVNIDDTRSGYVQQYTERYVTRYSVGTSYNVGIIDGKGNALTPYSHRLSRSRFANYSTPIGTTLLIDHTDSDSSTGSLVIAGGATTGGARIKLHRNGSTPVDALYIQGNNLLGMNGGYPGVKQDVPDTDTEYGEPGWWAANSSHLYIYTGDGTTHTWRRVGTNSF